MHGMKNIQHFSNHHVCTGLRQVSFGPYKTLQNYCTTESTFQVR